MTSVHLSPPELQSSIHFNFTGYEVWEFRFPDGTGELSNYAR